MPVSHTRGKPGPAWADTRSRVYWYDQYAVNEQETAFSAYDPDRITEELVSTGADIVTLYATNQFGIAYYPSRIWPQHPNLKGRDYVGDLTARLRARGRKIVLYSNWLDSKHPEWNVVPIDQQTDEKPSCRLASWADAASPNGRVQALPGGGWQTPCFNSPRREQAVAVAREIAERYHPDAFHLDMFFQTAICACEYCRPALEQICGTRDLTREAVLAHWRDYIDWRCSRSASLVAEVTRVLREHGVLAAHNALAPLYMPAHWGVTEQWLPWLDVFVSECFDAFLIGWSDLNTASLTVRWQHAVGKPSWILRTSAQPHFAHWTLTDAQWQLYAAACKANGGKVFGPCGVGARPDTTSSQHLLDGVKASFDFYMEDADLDTGAESAARVGLVFSWATRKYFEADPYAALWAEAFVGWARMLIEEHLPFDIVVAEDLTAEGLARYDLLVMPNTANLRTDCCEVIRAYVRDGGRILATGESSLRGDAGEARADFELAGVLGVSWKGSEQGCFAIEGAVEPEPAKGSLQHVTASGEVLARIVAVDPAGSVSRLEDPMPLGPTPWPAFTRHSFGAGQSLYAAFDIGKYYQRHGDEHIGARMAALVDALLPERQITVTAPRTVEVTVWRQPALPRTVVHLANRSVPWTLPTDQRQISEILPVHDVAVTLRVPYPDPKVSARGAKVRARTEKDRLTATISVLHAYAAIVIEPNRNSV